MTADTPATENTSVVERPPENAAGDSARPRATLRARRKKATTPLALEIRNEDFVAEVVHFNDDLVLSLFSQFTANS